MCEFCSKCKFGKVVPDPDPDDWFNDDDEAVLCSHPDMTLDKTDYTEKSKQHGWIQEKGWDKPGAIVIASGLRPYQVGKYDDRPHGCPLKTEPLLTKLLEKTGRLYKYVILKKDEKGYYIEYAFTKGAPHDNRCLDWYHSYQEEAYIRNKWTEGLNEKDAKERLANIKARIDSKVGKIYRLYDFTCGGEENPEDQIKRHKESHDRLYPDKPWVPEDCVCKVGCPAKVCNKTHWTKEQPVKCACWTLTEVNPDEITFTFNINEIKELLETLNK